MFISYRSRSEHVGFGLKRSHRTNLGVHRRRLLAVAFGQDRASTAAGEAA
jgi:hypothetical protein